MGNKYENVSAETRVWPDIKVNGHTLELDPGEVVEISPLNSLDPNLKEIKSKKVKPPVKNSETLNPDPKSEV